MGNLTQGKCKDCDFNDGKCYGMCVWDEDGFNPYVALMILAKRGEEDVKED